MEPLRPEKLIPLSFALLILIGTVLFQLPGMTTENTISWLDSLFMSTSAVCVTGLSVVDAGTGLSFKGQVLLLVLIQLGGLNFMNLSLFFSLLLKNQLSESGYIMLGPISKGKSAFQIFKTLYYVILLTLVVETVGAALLYILYKPYYPEEQILFQSIFHSVSAFCNSGFSLNHDSLMRFQSNAPILSVFMMLIVIGGIGFIVLEDVALKIKSVFKNNRRRFGLQSKVVFSMVLFLIIFGAILFFFTEKHNLFAQMSFKNKCFNSFFLSVTSRTAGFNTVDTGFLSNASLFGLVFFMIIGGGPTSMAGGVKVTTVAVLLALAIGQIRGHETRLFKRKIPAKIIAEAIAAFGAYIFLINFGTFLLQLTEGQGLSHTLIRGSFIEQFFEIVSATANVGLSTGITTGLSSAGKTILILLMFIGRIGPITIGLAIFMHIQKTFRTQYAEEEMVIG